MGLHTIPLFPLFSFLLLSSSCIVPDLFFYNTTLQSTTPTLNQILKTSHVFSTTNSSSQHHSPNKEPTRLTHSRVPLTINPTILHLTKVRFFLSQPFSGSSSVIGDLLICQFSFCVSGAICSSVPSFSRSRML